MRSVTIKVDDQQNQPRAFVSVRVEVADDQEERVYRSMLEVRADSVLSNQLVVRMRSAIAGWRRDLERFLSLAPAQQLDATLASADAAASQILVGTADAGSRREPLHFEAGIAPKLCALCSVERQKATAAIYALENAERVIRENLGPKAIPARPPLLRDAG